MNAAWKVSIFGVLLVHIFPHLHWKRRDTDLSPNAEKYRPENSEYGYVSQSGRHCSSVWSISRNNIWLDKCILIFWKMIHVYLWSSISEFAVPWLTLFLVDVASSTIILVSKKSILLCLISLLFTWPGQKTRQIP